MVILCQSYGQQNLKQYIVNFLFHNHMRSSLLNSYSSYGKYLPNDTPVQLNSQATIGSISLKQNFVHERPFVNCKFDIQANRLYLLDTTGTLIHVNLGDNSFSTLKSEKVKDFTIDGNNSLSLLYVTPKSELYRVSFDNKKPTKIMNLNMSKILAFERNYLRQMLMALDYKLLFICDLTRTGPSRIRSLKAGHHEVFTNASFASNNRYIIVAIKNVQVKIVEIMNLSTVHTIRLPFTVDNLKIEVSYDSKRIAIYGDCHIIFFININDSNSTEQFTYQLIEIPFVKTIPQLKYTYQNDIVFLGNDQILYAVSPEQLERAVPIFNQQYHVRMMGFDISLDCCKIAVVSNRTVMQLKFPKGLRTYISKIEDGKQIEYRKNGFDSVIESNRGGECQNKLIQECQGEDQSIKNQNPKTKIPNNHNYQYEDEDQSEQEQIDNSAINFTHVSNMNQGIPQLPLTFTNVNSHVSPYINNLNVSPTRKQQINFILNHLVSNYRNVSHHQAEKIVQILTIMTQKYRITAQNTLSVLDCIYKGLSMEIDKLQHYGLVLCPDIKAIIEKRFSIDFNQFMKDGVVTLCIQYFNQKQWIALINWLLSSQALGKHQALPLVFVAALQEILDHIHQRGQNEWHLFLNPDQNLQQQLTFNKVVLSRVNRIQSDEKYRTLFLKKKVSEYIEEPGVDSSAYLPAVQHGEGEKLEQLIVKQEEIKRALSKLQKGKKVNQ